MSYYKLLFTIARSFDIFLLQVRRSSIYNLILIPISLMNLLYFFCNLNVSSFCLEYLTCFIALHYLNFIISLFYINDIHIIEWLANSSRNVLSLYTINIKNNKLQPVGEFKFILSFISSSSRLTKFSVYSIYPNFVNLSD